MNFLVFEFQVGSRSSSLEGRKKSKNKKKKKEKLPLEEHEANRISPLHLFHVNTNWSHKKKNREGEFLHLFLKRLQMGRFLLETQATSTISATDANPRTLGGSNSDNKNMATLDTNMVIILAALLCALICALGLNSVLRCVLRCTRRFTPNEDPIDSNENANGAKGIKKQDLKRIPVDSYSLELKMKDTECLICLGGFVDGDKVRALPKCKHGFHVKCVDTWLRSHSSCPTCRQSLIEHQTLADGFHRDDDGTVATEA